MASEPNDFSDGNGEEPKPRRGRKRSKPMAPDPGLPAEPKKKDYHADPVGYCKEVLGISLTPMQQEIFRLVLLPPYRVLVSCGVGVGKSWMAACFISWFFDTFVPSVCITTAPTTRDIRDVIWAHVREQRANAGLGGMVGKVSAELRGEHDKHYAKGFASELQESFQGRHERFMGFIFDESTGVAPPFWISTKSMFHPRPGHHWICFFNPLDVSCQAYKEWQRGNWHKVQMSCLDHPNIAATLRGDPEPFPGAVSKDQIDDHVNDFCDPIVETERETTDIEWPPDSGKWFRPGPYMEARMLGRWPSTDIYGVWSRYAWACAQREIAWSPGLSIHPELGVDVAGHGDDDTAIHIRWGPVSIWHEYHNGWNHRQTASRVKMLCAEMAGRVNVLRPHDAKKIDPEEILVKIDGDGMGADLVTEADGFRFQAVCGSGRAMRTDKFHNKRAESWFHACQIAKDGILSVAQLPKNIRDRLEDQLLAPTWNVQPQSGKIILEIKDDTKERLGRSPDDADAMILAYCPIGTLAGLAWEQQAMMRALPEDQRKSLEPVTTSTPGTMRNRGGSLYYLNDDYEEPVKRHWRFGV